MPLDAQDKLQVEQIEKLLGKVATAPIAQAQLVQSGSQLARIILEIVPPDSPLRGRIIRRLEDTIELLAATTAPKAAA